MPEKKIRRTFSTEYKEEAVKLVLEQSAPVATVARDVGVHEQTLKKLGGGVSTRTRGEEPPLTVSERARLRELEKENRELRLKAEFLGKASAFFASEYR